MEHCDLRENVIECLAGQRLLARGFHAACSLAKDALRYVEMGYESRIHD